MYAYTCLILNVLCLNCIANLFEFVTQRLRSWNLPGWGKYIHGHRERWVSSVFKNNIFRMLFFKYNCMQFSPEFSFLKKSWSIQTSSLKNKWLRLVWLFFVYLWCLLYLYVRRCCVLVKCLYLQYPLSVLHSPIVYWTLLYVWR